MTQSVPPQQPQPQPQPSDGNPFAQKPADGNPYAAQPGAVPPPPAPPALPARNNIGLGVLVAVVVALVTAGIYGGIIGSTKYEIGYAAVGVGFLIGFAAGKVGGSNPVLPVVSAVLSLGAVYLGQLIGIAMIGSDEIGVSATTLFTEHFDLLNEGWKETADAMTFLFLGIGAFAAFSGAKKGAVA